MPLRFELINCRYHAIVWWERTVFQCYHISQGVHLTWDAVKGCLVSFCSVTPSYQILTAQPENYAAGKKL